MPWMAAVCDNSSNIKPPLIYAIVAFRHPGGVEHTVLANETRSQVVRFVAGRSFLFPNRTLEFVHVIHANFLEDGTHHVTDITDVVRNTIPRSHS